MHDDGSTKNDKPNRYPFQVIELQPDQFVGDFEPYVNKSQEPERTPGGFPNPLYLHDVLSKDSREIIMKKNHDYTSGSGDPYSNFRAATVLNISSIKGILLRAQDKIMRIQTFDEKGTLQVAGESVKDALMDVINYMVLIYGLVKEKEEKGED